MKILAIETSCDETAVAVVSSEGGSDDATFTVRGNALYSQAQKHAKYGGVYPSLAKREHAANLVPLLESALNEARLSFPAKKVFSKEQEANIQKILEREPGLAQAIFGLLQRLHTPEVDAIAVTKGPGLEPALWVGINFARALSYLWDLPIIPVNHLEGHIIASAVQAENDTNYKIGQIDFPLLGLVISGGHTEFVHAKTWGSYKVVGATRDDSIGEAFDKVARILGLPYPGGPRLSELAQQGRKTLATRPAHLMKDIKKLPRPMIQSDDLDFSFSGLKTAVLYMVRDLGDINDIQRTLIAAEFEEAVAEVVTKKISKALSLYPSKTFVLGGGVSANAYIRLKLEYQFNYELHDCMLRLPAPGLSTDNAIMIAMAGYFMHLRNVPKLEAKSQLTADGNFGM